jgi:hypothetical protein
LSRNQLCYEAARGLRFLKEKSPTIRQSKTKATSLKIKNKKRSKTNSRSTEIPQPVSPTPPPTPSPTPLASPTPQPVLVKGLLCSIAMMMILFLTREKIHLIEIPLS